MFFAYCHDKGIESLKIKSSGCVCVRYARLNQWVEQDQTLHAGSLPPGAGYRGGGVQVGISLLAGTYV